VVTSSVGGRLCELRDLAANRLADSGGHVGVGHSAGPGPGHARHLHDEQRVALTSPFHGGQDVGPGAGQQGADLLAGQPAQRHQGGVGFERADHLAELIIEPDFHVGVPSDGTSWASSPAPGPAASSRAATPAFRSNERRTWTHGQYGGAPPSSQAPPHETCAPWPRARRANVAASVVLPIPGSPEMSTRPPPRPFAASARASPSVASSASRPTKRDALATWPLSPPFTASPPRRPDRLARGEPAPRSVAMNTMFLPRA